MYYNILVCYSIGSIESMSVLSGCFRIYCPEHVSKFILYYIIQVLHYTHTQHRNALYYTREFISVVLIYSHIYTSLYCMISMCINCDMIVYISVSLSIITLCIDPFFYLFIHSGGQDHSIMYCRVHFYCI